jgi:hypothetical protein
MSFGFKAFNDVGEVVVDDVSPVFAITKVESITGTLEFTGTPDGNLYKHTILPNDELFFFRLPNVGSIMGAAPQNFFGQNGWFSNFPTVETFRCRRVNAFTDTPSGYGMVIKDQSGNITFRADKNTVVIEEGLQLKFGKFPQASSRQWFCIPNAYAGIFSVSGSTFFFDGTQIKRMTSTTISQDGYSDNKHEDFPPFLVLTANAIF